MTIIQSQDSAGLFEPFLLGDISLKHRVVMAPMTRLRAGKDDGIPSEWAEEYYSSRATDGGLMLSEATSPSKDGRVWPYMPGIWSEEQIQQWRKITDAVHAKGGKMVLQIAQAGRVAIPGVNPVVYAPSNNHDPTPGALQPEMKVMDQKDINQSIKEFTEASKNAIRAGFDGVEIHAANGYLLDQFIQSVSNLRTDSYGGSIDNRIKFPIEVLKTVTSAIPAQKVGLRVSPFATYQGMREPIGEESGPIKTFSRLLEKIYEEIPTFGYIHALEPRSTGDGDQSDDKLDLKDSIDPLRQIVLNHGSHLIVAGGYTPASAKVHGEKYNELIAFGRSFTSNPDLVERIKYDLPLTKYDRSTFYTQGKEGYLGWPTYQNAVKVAA
ncbi:hypothetical protein V866_005331 [Kwoniella sp. B9012]|uniref:NADH:flavin oxidoreductase/NADH oxidase N-terminal domain-containing protein n=1 Tax=Kwoniella europaea PYCC6329 TaxID=1423913 RepID=A0AAX4KLL2_9TREE